MSKRVLILPEGPGVGRLGRHVEHDPRSKHSFAVGRPEAPHKLRSVAWHRHSAIFNQGDVGSCTGNAMAGVLGSEPFFTRARRPMTERVAVDLYSDATRLDDIAGDFPPDDTGSSGLAVAKAAQRRGWIGVYRHALSLDDVLQALQRAPCIVGLNWYEGFDHPHGIAALITIAGEVRGGHEVAINEIDVERKQVRFAQSWGAAWGCRGYGSMSFETLERLLAEDGDATVFL